jgi:hypothetical protein
MEWWEELLHETQLQVRISYVTVMPGYSLPCSASFTSAEAAPDRINIP